MIGQIMNCDALEMMKMIPDNEIDLLLTDPPQGYFSNKELGKNVLGGYNEWNEEVPSKEVFQEMFRISKVQIIWGGNYFELPINRHFLIWDKKQPLEGFARCEYAWTNLEKNAQIFEYMCYGNTNREKWRKHPTQKPLELMRWCIEQYSRKRTLICDPFAGSFTTARACKDMTRRFIACDLRKDYCEVGEERMKQQMLF